MPRQSPPQTRRPGFTLIELLMVILIVGVLVGLLIPAISGAVRSANNAKTSAEINTMAQALETFKTTYGEYPPSRVILMENGYYDTTSSAALDATGWLGGTGPNYATAAGQNDVNFGKLADRSLRSLRKFWPRAGFQQGVPPPAGSAIAHNFNGDLTTAGGEFISPEPILLQGHECLAFFLGGLPSSSGVGVSGFSKDPKNPFRSDNAATNRTTPLFEFKGDRLRDDDGDKVPGYVDPLATGNESRYYAYFYSYGNNGYDPNDVNFTEVPSGLTTFKVNWTTFRVASIAPNPYTTSLPVAATGPTAYEKPQSYQILSPGHDRLYGQGGQYAASSNGSRLPAGSGVSRAGEADNLSNFSGGTLD